MNYHGYLGLRNGTCVFEKAGESCGFPFEAKVHSTDQPVFTDKVHAYTGLRGGRCEHDAAGIACNRLAGNPVHKGTTPQYLMVPKGMAKQIGESLGKAFALKPGALVSEPEPQYFPGDARGVWQEHARLVAAKLEEKVGYGSAWQEQGYMGNLARIQSKTSRLKNLLWRDDCGPDLQMDSDESVLDTLLDLSALCALAISNIEEGNRWGRT